MLSTPTRPSTNDSIPVISGSEYVGAMSMCSDQAWNNFVMFNDPGSYERGSNKRAAAVANLFMGGANNGGLNSFLTSSHDLDADEVLEALTALGAGKAAHQLEAVLRGLGRPLNASSKDERWALLDERWHDDLDQHDVLNADADAELMQILETHVGVNEEFYAGLRAMARTTK